MALREIRVEGDPVLTKVCKEVKEVTPRVQDLIDDMIETMYEANGVGLAAPQVGILKRIVVIDVGEGPIVMINPRIINTDGEQTGDEGCLSVPNTSGVVTRPDYVKVKALNEDMEEIDEEKVIKYTDLTGILMSSVKTIVDSVSYVLIAFVAISLVVSSIMMTERILYPSGIS